MTPLTERLGPSAQPLIKNMNQQRFSRINVKNSKHSQEMVPTPTKKNQWKKSPAPSRISKKMVHKKQGGEANEHRSSDSMNKKSLSMEKHEEAEEIDLQNTTLDQYMKSFKTDKVDPPKENKDKRRSPLTLDVQLNKNSGIMLNE